LASRDGQAPSSFEIAGADGAFVPAQASIEGNSVLVWSDSIAEPIQVRFAWHQEANPNLMNRAGLPAVPFRSGH
jgi:sialate O-acetylesterase